MALKIAVIGAGPAGYPAALTAAKLGAEVTVIEKGRPGGVCLNCGCIPSKSLLDAAHRFDVVRDISRFCNENAAAQAQAIAQDISWPKIQQRQQAVTQRLSAGILALFRQAKITYMQGTASFKDAHTLSVTQADSQLDIAFDFAIAAPGTKAFVPPPFDKIKVYTNADIFDMPALPHTLAIIGGGAIGCEFAALMSSLGVKVNLIEMQPRLLPALDENLSRVLAQSLQKRGVNLLLGKQVLDAKEENGKYFLTLSDSTVLETDAVLAAIGRTCDLTDLKPENAGLDWDRKGFKNVNPQTLQVSPTVYAAGDVTGLSLLAHAGTRQGMVAAANCCGKKQIYNNDFIPNAIYTSPEIASVGLHKAQAEARGLTVKSRKVFVMANARALTMDETAGFAEILTEEPSGKLLGAHLAAPNASEIISAFTVALEAGFTLEQLQKVVFPHPTVSEIIADALNK